MVYLATTTMPGAGDIPASSTVIPRERRGIMLADTKKRRREPAAAGLPITETGFLRRLRIDPADLPLTALRMRARVGTASGSPLVLSLRS